MTAIVLRGDARHLPLPDALVDLVVTSPPYFGLRSYTDGGEHYTGQIGSEGNPAEYVAALLDCTREWMRVLTPGGSLFINLGDRYCGERSLLGLPWRYALGCIDDLGLILRAEVVWAKPNGLPESATDRVRRSHEQIFHFAMQSRYYAAIDEVREPHAPASMARYRSGFGQTTYSAETDKRYRADEVVPNPLGKLPESVWRIPSQPLNVPDHLGIDHFAAFPIELPRRCILGWSPPCGVVLDPFGGTGTTALVAAMHGRTGISVDRSADYCRLARWRTTDPAERAKALGVPKPPPVPAGQDALFG